MFEARFENKYGLIRFGGGSGPVFRTKEFAGLGPPKKEFKVAGYAGQPGQELISEKDLARVITLSGDVIPRGSMQRELARMIKILYHPGKLTILSGSRKRSIRCRCTDFDDPERRGKKNAGTVIQFTCDNPYFTDDERRRVDLFQRKNLIQTTFTLPCAFSSRVNRLNVINSGDVQTEPVFTIYNSGTASALAESYGIEIENHTTGQSLLIERHTQSGEVITIDIPARKITSSIAGDITASISQDTYLSDFWLSEGANDIEAVNYNAGEDISVVMEYDNKYIEAVY